MPNLGFDTREARLLEWLKQPGDAVTQGETIALVESDKTTVELESVATGLLLEQRYPADAVITVGTVIALVGDDSAPPSHSSPSQSSPAPPKKNAPTIKALPRTRKLAREKGINLQTVVPRQAGGIISDEDVRATVSGDKPLSPARRVVADRLTASMRDAPHFYVSGEIDMEPALTQVLPDLRLNDLILYAAVQALKRVPVLNATFDGTTIRQSDRVDLCVAVATDAGLLTPVLSGVEKLSPSDLATRTRALLSRARAGRLTTSDIGPGTFTVSNLGVVSLVDQFTAVINTPQVAILAAGAVKARPVVRDGGLHVRHTLHLTLGGDHRVLDGMDLARFLTAFQETINRFPGGDTNGESSKD